MWDLFMLMNDCDKVKIELIWGTLTGVTGTVLSYFFGAWNTAIETLVVLMVIDYISGVLAAYINPHLVLNSQRGFRGILKKIMILMLVSLGHFLDTVVGSQLICSAVTFFFLGNEGLSVIENAAKAGVPIPRKLRDTLEQLANEKEERKENSK